MGPLERLMPSCRDVYVEASQFLDGEMGWWRRLMFRLHLRMCSACAEVVRQFELVRGAAPLAVDGSNDDLRDDVRNALLDEFGSTPTG